ncbi:MAG: metallophosphoesterase [Candidatus Anstonellales archaeon]
MRFITGHPAAIFKNALVVADMHFGIEQKYLDYENYSLSWELAEKLVGLAKKHRKEKIFILGDVKDSILSTPKLVAEILDFLAKDFGIWVAKGNHDGNIQKLKIKNVKIFQKGFIYGGAAFFHGHALPPKELLNKNLIFMSHGHIEYNGEKVWLVSKTGKKKIIVVPSFNPVVGKNISSPIGPLFRNKIFKWLPSKLYTLNGVLIGNVGKLVEKD